MTAASAQLEAVRTLLDDPDARIRVLARAVLAPPSAPAVVRIGIADLEARLGVDRSTVWRMCRAGAFPAPSYVGTRRVWEVAEVEAWEAEQRAVPHKPVVRGIAARRAKGARRTP
jgi:predicted DNA-binding transcriptional regulator AlpA